MEFVSLSISYAKLFKLLTRAIAGEDVPIILDDKPVAKIVAISASKEKAGLQMQAAAKELGIGVIIF